MTGLAIAYVRMAAICPSSVDAINKQTQNSQNILTKFRSLLISNAHMNVQLQLALG